MTVEHDASEEIDEKDVAYVAGIVDGEGCLGIKKNLLHQDGPLDEPAISRASPGKDDFRERSEVHPPSVSWQFA